MKYPPVENFPGDQIRQTTGETLRVVSPLDGSILSEVCLSSVNDLQRAYLAAEQAYLDWSTRTIKERVQVFFRYRELLAAHGDELANLVHEENGKTMDEARAEVDKAMEVTEFACSLPQLVTGEVLQVSPGVECRVDLEPLGVVASVTPFNFPIMVPHWTLPIAIALGNAFILKPSEQVPLSATRCAELLSQAGLPAGICQVLHGDRRLVEALCDHPHIAAISFVGSTPAAKSVYIRASSRLKRVLALGGAKNHLVVLPDADCDSTAENVAESMSGCAGQRCMAASALIAVGEVDHVIERICDRVRQIVPGVNLGAVISPQAQERIEQSITEAEQAGAQVLVDGRRTVVSGCENGSYVGPTVIDNVTPDMKIAQAEVFGPVLAVIRARDIDQAIEIENASPFGNAASVYTQSGSLARRVVDRAAAGMVGVNIGVPVPREPFGFGGWNDSKFGVGDITGKSSIGFWTRAKKVTTRWSPVS